MITIDNIMKVADIAANDVTVDLLTAIAGMDTYRDQILNENLYSTENILEEVEGDEPLSDDVRAELEEINELLNQNDCAYFRLTFN